MKKKQQLEKIFINKINLIIKKADLDYLNYNFDNFLYDLKKLYKDIKNNKIIASMQVSKSGMTRYFNFYNNHNFILNILYNQKASFGKVKVTGCGMDMAFHLLHQSTKLFLKEKEHSANNSNFSNIIIL